MAKQKIEKLDTYPVVFVRTECPATIHPTEKRALSFCKSCEFFLPPNSHGWKEYAATIVRQWDEIEDHDVDITDYYKVIKCSKCGYEIVFYSSYSCLVKGDHNNCPKCGTYHYYVGDRANKPIFLIPLKRENNPRLEAKKK